MSGIKRILLISMVFVFYLPGSGKQTPAGETGKFEKPLNKVQFLAGGKLRYLVLTGTPYERGLTHGRLLKKEIQEVIRLFKDDIKKTTKHDPERFIAKFLGLTDYITSIKKRIPELLEELKGISKGSGIDFDTIFMHQLVDEYWCNVRDILVHKCTSFGINRTASNPSMTAQNMDIPRFFHGYQTVIKIDVPGSDNDIMVLTIPGHLGITGMNRKGVSICCNTLIQLKYSRSGIPVTFVVRGVVAKNSQKDALAFINEIRHASGQNYILGGPEKVYSLECSSNEVHEFRPFQNSVFTYHTNHPLRNRDFNKRFLAYLSGSGKKLDQVLNTCRRLPSLRKRFNKDTSAVSIQDIREALSSRDHQGRDVVSNSSTYASVIYVLSKIPRFIIAPGKPHETKYLEIRFK